MSDQLSPMDVYLCAARGEAVEVSAPPEDLPPMEIFLERLKRQALEELDRLDEAGRRRLLGLCQQPAKPKRRKPDFLPAYLKVVK